MKTKKDNKNPLYTVTNRGKDVEECKSFIDMIIKKFNLSPAVNVLTEIITMLLEQVKSYPTLVFFNEFMEKLMRHFSKFAF